MQVKKFEAPTIQEALDTLANLAGDFGKALFLQQMEAARAR